jgi:hypothetical protein
VSCVHFLMDLISHCHIWGLLWGDQQTTGQFGLSV